MARYRVDVSFAGALAVIGAVIAWLLLGGLVSAASRPLGWLIASATVALLLSPLVALLDRRLPRWAAIVASLLLVAVVAGGAWVTVAATLADNADEIRSAAPAAAADLEDDYTVLADFELERRVSSFVDELDDRIGGRAQVERAASTAPTYVVTGVLMLFLLIYGPRFVRGGLAQIDDESRRTRLAAILDRTVVRSRSYLLLALARVLVTTILLWLVFVLLDLDASFLLALIVGGFTLIPDIGLLLGGLPAVLLVAASGGAAAALGVAVIVVGLQLVDGVVVHPRIEARTLHIGPALPLVTALIGWELYGIGGAVYGIALLVMLLALSTATSTSDEGVDVVPADARSPQR